MYKLLSPTSFEIRPCEFTKNVHLQSRCEYSMYLTSIFITYTRRRCTKKTQTKRAVHDCYYGQRKISRVKKYNVLRVTEQRNLPTARRSLFCSQLWPNPHTQTHHASYPVHLFGPENPMYKHIMPVRWVSTILDKHPVDKHIMPVGPGFSLNPKYRDIVQFKPVD